jgi:hypothetical protein
MDIAVAHRIAQVGFPKPVRTDQGPCRPPRLGDLAGGNRGRIGGRQFPVAVEKPEDVVPDNGKIEAQSVDRPPENTVPGRKEEYRQEAVVAQIGGKGGLNNADPEYAIQPAGEQMGGRTGNDQHGDNQNAADVFEGGSDPAVQRKTALQ